MKKLNDNWLIFDDEASLSKALSQEILTIAKKTILENDRFNIVLTGGRSVISLYKILSESNSNWNKWHIYISDERFLPVGHKDRNDRLINEIWLDNSKIPKQNINFIKAELGLDEARLSYENTLKKINKFDVVLLSMGEDGHIASLFPNHVYPEEQMVVIERSSPKPPINRISMSYNSLNNSKYVIKLIVGKSKQRSAELFEKKEDIPITNVRGVIEKVFFCKSCLV